MTILTVLCLFGFLATLIAVFEVFYWFLTQCLGVIAHVKKATLVGIFWLMAMIAAFLLYTFPDIRVMLCGLVAYVLHAEMCGKFSLLRRRGAEGRDPEYKPDNKMGYGYGKGSQSLQSGGEK